MMDGDLQDPPELLKAMYQKLVEKNCQIVYGKRTGRKEKFARRMFIKIFHLIFSKFSNSGKDAEAGNFSMFNREALNVLLSLEERSRYLPGLRSYIGFSQDYVEYPRSEREIGEPRMAFFKLVNLSFDAIFSFTDFPIKMCIYTGLFGLFLFFLAILYAVISKLTGIAPLGWSSTLLSIYFLGSIQLLFLGVIGEYIARIYKESLSRPIYIVKEFIE
jgi:glycosyltransferase involved in cell wall biosynthesis